MIVVLSPVVQVMVRVSLSWLRQRIDAGVSVRTIAAELNITERTVRNRLQRAGIPLPSEVKAARIELDDVFAAYREGEPVVRIARRCGVSSRWVTDRLSEHGVTRDVPMQPKVRRSRYPALDDRHLWPTPRSVRDGTAHRGRGHRVLIETRRTSPGSNDGVGERQRQGELDDR